MHRITITRYCRFIVLALPDEFLRNRFEFLPIRFQPTWIFRVQKIRKLHLEVLHVSKSRPRLFTKAIHRHRCFPFAISLSIFSFSFFSSFASPLVLLQNLILAASVLVIVQSFLRLRIAPTGISFPSPFATIRRALASSIVYSSQLDDVRRAKLHFAAILHLLHDLITAIVLVRVDVVAPLVAVVLLLQVLQDLTSI